MSFLDLQKIIANFEVPHYYTHNASHLGISTETTRQQTTINIYYLPDHFIAKREKLFSHRNHILSIIHQSNPSVKVVKQIVKLFQTYGDYEALTNLRNFIIRNVSKYKTEQIFDEDDYHHIMSAYGALQMLETCPVLVLPKIVIIMIEFMDHHNFNHNGINELYLNFEKWVNSSRAITKSEDFKVAFGYLLLFGRKYINGDRNLLYKRGLKCYQDGKIFSCSNCNISDMGILYFMIAQYESLKVNIYDEARYNYWVSIIYEKDIYQRILSLKGLSRNCCFNDEYQIGLKLIKCVKKLSGNCYNASEYLNSQCKTLKIGMVRKLKRMKCEYCKCNVKVYCCKGCMKLFYCSRSCQKKHWKVRHSTHCDKFWKNKYDLLKQMLFETVSF
eukprot:535040_1